MTLSFKDITNDPRMEPLFSDQDRPCVFQMWFLEFKTEKEIRYDFLFARLIPHHTSNNGVFVSNPFSCNSEPQATAKIFSVSYYLTSSKTKNFFEDLFSGFSLEKINQKYLFRFLNKDEKTEFFKTCFLSNQNLIFSNVYFCLNRSNFTNNRNFSGPLEEGGSVCASVWLNERFSIVRNWDAHLYVEILKRLADETGINFNERKNLSRLCSLEFCTFPSINLFEQQLFSVNWYSDGISLSYIPSVKQLPKKYLFSFTVFNGQNITNSWIAIAQINFKGHYEAFIHLTKQELDLIDGYDIKLYTQKGSDSFFTLAFHQQLALIKEVAFEINANSGDSAVLQSSWLEKTLSKKYRADIEKVQTVGGRTRLSNTLNFRKCDHWSVSNREFKNYLLNNFPKSSEGKFFPRIKDRSTSRLEFVRWFKKVFSEFDNCQVYLFDPFFDHAGLYLLALSSVSSSSYQVYTRLEDKKIDKPNRIETIKRTYEKIKKLLPQTLNLTINGLPSHYLHDRYILFLNKKTGLIKGFQLSNSLEKQSDRHPLLVTPIPQDILFDVWRYSRQLITSEKCKEIFNSLEQEKESLNLTIFDRKNFGKLCAEVYEAPCLQELSGLKLMEKMSELGLYDSESSRFVNFTKIVDVLNSFRSKDTRLLAKWDLYADLLANIPFDFAQKRSLSDETIEFLSYVLKDQLAKAQVHTELKEKVSGGVFSLTKEDLFMHCKHRPFIHGPKPENIDWSEFYSITLLGLNSFSKLLQIFDDCTLPNTLKSQRLFECAYWITSNLIHSLPMDFEKAKLLLSCKNNWLKSIGYSSIAYFAEHNFCQKKLEVFFSQIPLSEVFACLLWGVLYFGGPSAKTEKFEYYLQKLLEMLPTNEISDGTSDSYLGFFMNPVRKEWWFFREVLLPAMAKKKINETKVLDCVMERFVSELKDSSQVSSLFRDDCSILLEVVNLLVKADQLTQEKWIRQIEEILGSNERVVSKPLIRNCKYSDWNNSMNSLMQIFIFLKLLSIRLDRSGCELSKLIYEMQSRAKSWVKLRPSNEWSMFSNEFREMLDV